jgi:hypothetical protein
MVGQISTVYFQSYQLAYDVAKRTEMAFQHELAVYDGSFIEFGYWDNLKKGLLAGERLNNDLRRMEAAYLDKDARELELRKHVSLARLDPAALIQLRETGSCEVEIPEALFNLDYPGHYMRRLKSVSLSIPSVTGPYTGVQCTVTLLANRIRVNAVDGETPYEGSDDPNFITNIGGIQSIATSSGQDDSGLFELNLGDERYLPFEGAGAVGRWRLELENEFRAFDYDTISDVILHLRYTARDGGASLRKKVAAALSNSINEIVSATELTGLHHFTSLRHEHATEFHHFLHPEGSDLHKTAITFSRDQLPYMFAGRKITISGAILLLKLRHPNLYKPGKPLAFEVQRSDKKTSTGKAEVVEGAFGGLPHCELTQIDDLLDAEERWILQATQETVSLLPAELRREIIVDGKAVDRLRPEEIMDIGLLIHYEVGDRSE